MVNIFSLLITFVSKLSAMITSFVDQFGVISNVQLSKLNKTVSIQLHMEEDASNPKDIVIDNDGTGAETESMRKLSLMIRDMSKYTILICVATVSTSVLMIFFILCVSKAFRLARRVTAIFIVIDGIVNCLCLYLQYHINRKTYHKLCIKLHKYCELRYTKDINTTLRKHDTLLKIKKLDDKGTVGIERIATMDKIDLQSAQMASNLTDIVNQNSEEQDGDTNNAAKNSRQKAFADMRSFSQTHLT